MKSPRLPRSRTRGQQAGFTLVEVLIALAILFGALVMMLSRVTADVQATNEAKLLTAATGLARGKMLDIEEILVDKGFQELDQTLEGDFSDEGYPRFSWSAKIEKIELPPMSSLQAADQMKEQAQGSGPSPPGLPNGVADKSAGQSLITSQFDMIAKILGDAVRKVSLTVSWKVGATPKKMVVVCYFTSPKAIKLGF